MRYLDLLWDFSVFTQNRILLAETQNVLTKLCSEGVYLTLLQQVSSLNQHREVEETPRKLDVVHYFPSRYRVVLPEFTSKTIEWGLQYWDIHSCRRKTLFVTSDQDHLAAARPCLPVASLAVDVDQKQKDTKNHYPHPLYRLSSLSELLSIVGVSGRIVF